ncbi:ATP-binding cassette domain-containing protein [Fontibacter flavus]|uniref:ATP-binding cassette domain-containing protein n=1 Tax=Fontibacter flavus TaxID=654838 RepID=A0ABV6FW74_9BACT
MTKILSICNATIRHLDKVVFEELDFEWEQGQYWAIIGRSGAEQTTFLETIMGKTLVTKGEVVRPFAEAYQKEMSNLGKVNSFRDLIATVSQQYTFRNKSNIQNFYYQQRFNSMESEETSTVLEYLRNVPQHNPGKWTLEKVLQLMRLETLKHKSLIKLSNGETRRLAIGVALMKNPSVLLLDQPLTGLDAKTRESFDTVIKQIIGSGIHLMMTTHRHEIPESVSHVAVLGEKKIIKVCPRKGFDLQQEDEQGIMGIDQNILAQLLLKNEKVYASPIVDLRNVTVKYGEKVILDRVNWTVLPGEKWVLKGENGKGKSTLISLIIGENPQAYANDIWLFGRKRGSGESIWDIKQNIGFVAPELSRFFPANQTCLKVVLSGLFDTMGLFRKNTDEQEELAINWLQLFGLEKLAHKLFKQVTLEEQRFVLLARALIKRPSLLVLDEASQGMDEYQRALFKRIIDQVCYITHLTLIYVSHYQEDVPKAVNKVFQL